MANKLFKIMRNDQCGYDQFNGGVICAKNEKQVREIAEKEFSFFGCDDLWSNPEKSTVSAIQTTETGIILSDFLAG